MAREDIKEKVFDMTKKTKEELKIELDLTLKNRILALDIMPIEKKTSRDFSLLDYIGFIDE